MTRSMAASFFTRGCFARASATTFLVVVLLVLSPTPTRAKLPKNEDREVLCEACNATLAELSNLVAKTEKRAGGRESAVEDALETLCDDMYRFVTYAYPPPKMQKGCRVIVEEYADELSTLVYAKDDARTRKCAQRRAKASMWMGSRRGSGRWRRPWTANRTCRAKGSCGRDGWDRVVNRGCLVSRAAVRIVRSVFAAYTSNTSASRRASLSKLAQLARLPGAVSPLIAVSSLSVAPSSSLRRRCCGDGVRGGRRGCRPLPVVMAWAKRPAMATMASLPFAISLRLSSSALGSLA